MSSEELEKHVAATSRLTGWFVASSEASKAEWADPEVRDFLDHLSQFVVHKKPTPRSNA